MKFSTTEKFDSDFKRLSKKFRSLKDDLESLKTYGIELFHKEMSTVNIVHIPGFSNIRFELYKVRSIACKSLKSRGKQSGLRLIYAYESEKDESIFLELYFKGEKENEDRERIKSFLSLSDKK